MDTVLVIDNDRGMRLALSEFLSENGFDPLEAHDGVSALEMAKRVKPDMVLLDPAVPGVDGTSCMDALRSIDPSVTIIVMASRGDAASAVLAVERGAYDYFLMPPNFDRLRVTVRRAAEGRKLKRALTSSLDAFFGKSLAMRAIAEQIPGWSVTDCPVVIQGEAGTGKSFIARTIHDFSARSAGPFVSAHMGLCPGGLSENVLFEDGQGIPAPGCNGRKGFFELSHGGTIVIDEPQNLSFQGQRRLLKVLEEKKVLLSRSAESIDVDVRVIAASRTDLTESVRDRKMREDLYFRMAQWVLLLPPLRERREDIPFLVRKFVNEASDRPGPGPGTVSDEAMDCLCSYSWPGNVRELRNVVRKALRLCPGGVIGREHIRVNPLPRAKGARESFPMSLKEVVRDAEERAIRRALEREDGRRTRAAGILGVSRSSLMRKMKRYGIS